ncbi:MAG: Ni/Fe hydrogenase subunit alpha [Candidatus Micrarchaeota archaeon]|nr:Ni/Fe hydrogenase subunit alpha [Candidatus Micrarchaeota archaeon]
MAEKTIRTKKAISIEALTKIEGNARLAVVMDGKQVKDVRLEVVEGARYFESIIKGRRFDQIPEVTERICGTCGPGHLNTALAAIEDALGIQPSEQTMLLRELIQIGMFIQNHSLHLHFLALPDYLGFDNAIEMAKKHPEAVKRAIELKKFGNKIVTIAGGREVHPMRPVVGGFTKTPSRDEWNDILVEAKSLKPRAVEVARLFSKVNYPRFERATEYVALRGKRFALLDGAIASTAGPAVEKKDFKKHAEEAVKPYSSAKFASFAGKPYMVGSLARINLNQDRLGDDAKRCVAEGPIKFPSSNPFHINYAQAIELVQVFDQMIDLMENHSPKQEAPVEARPRAGTGVGVTEVSRGTLYHQYALDRQGRVVDADIMTPTAQNLHNIEEDLKAYLPPLAGQPDEKIALECEKLIRSYDPCISCATHFLELEIKRKPTPTPRHGL